MFIALGTPQQFRVDDICDHVAFLRAVPLLLQEEDRLVICSYGVGARPDVVDFLKRHQLPADEYVARQNKYLRETEQEDYPQAFVVLWPADLKLLQELAELLGDDSSSLDLGHHIAAYGPRGPLFLYHDAFSGDPFYISTHVPEGAVAIFCKTLGTDYKMQAEEM